VPLLGKFGSNRVCLGHTGNVDLTKRIIASKNGDLSGGKIPLREPLTIVEL
jgi:hypothetical protein